jgi:hypothetical protein
MLKRYPTGQLRIHRHRHSSPCRCPAPICRPFGEVGRQTFDGKGHTEATATASTNGNIVKVTIVGTYTVNPERIYRDVLAPLDLLARVVPALPHAF